MAEYFLVCDADVDIATAALNEARHTSVTVAAEDTDILVLLAYHLSDDMNDIIMLSQTTSKQTGQCGSFSIRDIQHSLGKTLCNQLPAVHAIGGCDTTSGIYGIGKGTILSRLSNASDVQHPSRRKCFVD